MRVQPRRSQQNSAVFFILGLTIGGVLLARLTPSKRRPAFVDAASTDDAGLSSYFSSARQLLSTGLDAHNSARTYSSLMPNENPRTEQMLRETIERTSDLIEDYQHEGLSNFPALPNAMGLGALTRLPDKLLRAEMSMLQGGIRMAEEMRERPIQATINVPQELSTMFMRMLHQLNQ
ncbi:uncharacterized protein LOC129879810 [Solanum dulcamara]|uniref:uncharacterized protein LOC129879810 n=1 Tax=Solanum dulcamara TaxID=45834 RepID=UPI0024851677|nr:uncharacterized protein LOC129879810 [Solanum dulcamara]